MPPLRRRRNPAHRRGEILPQKRIDGDFIDTAGIREQSAKPVFVTGKAVRDAAGRLVGPVEGRIAKTDAMLLATTVAAMGVPSFAAVARECGLHAQRVEYAAELDAALRTALDTRGPALVELVTDAELI